MNRILADAKAFGKQYLRSRTGTFFALAFPVILILLFGAIFSSTGSSKVSLYVQDLDNTPLSHAFIQALNNTTVISYNQIPSDVSIADYIHAHALSLALEIPNGFNRSIVAARLGNRTVTANVTLYGDQTQSTYGIAVAAINAVATQFNFQISNARPVVIPATQPITEKGSKYIDIFLPGMIGFTILTTPLFGMTSICGEYRTRKYFKFLATTKLSKAEWLAAKILFYTLLMFVSMALVFVTGVVVFQMDGTITLMAIVLIAVGTVEFTSLGMLLGIFVKDTETAAAIANAIGFPMMFLSGTFFPVDLFPSYLKTVANFLPLTYLNEGLRATMVFGNDATALVDLAITAVIAVIFFAIPARALSWKSK
ncbi:MAG TPA: ABC transporter permease [Thermoplasmata archaeon]|nr:ABC transporter permease [Thermoplasmata archaeon]